MRICLETTQYANPQSIALNNQTSKIENQSKYLSQPHGVVIPYRQSILFDDTPTIAACDRRVVIDEVFYPNSVLVFDRMGPKQPPTNDRQRDNI